MKEERSKQITAAAALTSGLWQHGLTPSAPATRKEIHAFFFAVTLTMSCLSLYWLQCRDVSKHNPGCSREYMYTCCQSTWWERFKNLLKGRNQVSVKGSLHSEEPGARTRMRIPRCKRTETPTQTVSLHHRQVTQSSHLRQITTFCGVSATLHPRSVEAANHWLITETGEEQKIT